MIGLLRKRPPHVYDLTVLYGEVEGLLELPKEVSQGLSELSAYYVLARYPNAGLRRPSLSIGRVQAERAVSIAEGVVKAVERKLKPA